MQNNTFYQWLTGEIEASLAKCEANKKLLETTDTQASREIIADTTRLQVLGAVLAKYQDTTVSGYVLVQLAEDGDIPHTKQKRGFSNGAISE